MSLFITVHIYEFPTQTRTKTPLCPIQTTKSIQQTNKVFTTAKSLPEKDVAQIIADDEMTLAFDDLNLDVGRWDNRRLYKMFDFALVGDNYVNASNDNLVCLATQSSVERLYSLVQVADKWRGPISLAIYVAGNEEFTILQYYISYLRECFDYIRSNVTIHVAVPKNREPKLKTQQITDKITNGLDCKYPQDMLFLLLRLRSVETTRWRIKNEYPQNHLRNLARKGCQTKFVFLTDIDIIPNQNMVPLLNRFLSRTTCLGKCAYVIPTFEIDLRASFPSSKNELLRLYKKGLARPFHEKVFIYNQYATNFSR